MAAILGAMAVVAGAMLAHLLKNRMPESALEIYETAVRYQFYHVFALLTAGVLGERFQNKWIISAGMCFIGGIFFFSGSLYIISVFLTNGIAVPLVLGLFTPLGGLGFILGWIFLAMAIFKGRST